MRAPTHKDPGYGVLVDKIVSAQSSLIPYMSSFLSNQRIWVCTTCVDNVNDYVYVHCMQYLSLSVTILAKVVMEKIMAQAGQTVNHYQANNRIFSYNVFANTISEKNQRLTFYGVGAHHQNGIIENKNKILTTGAITLVLHGIRMWPQNIDEIFWPFSIKSMAKILKSFKIDLKDITPESILHGIEVEYIFQ